MKHSRYTQDWVDDVVHCLRLDDNHRPSRLPASAKMSFKSEASLDGSGIPLPGTAATALIRLRKLPQFARLVLCTPVMVPSGFLKSDEAMDKGSQAWTAAPDVDPFEMLGLAISKRNRCVRHVPYVPAVGFTETHRIFAMEADALLVVACEPEPLETKANRSPADGTRMAMQSAFISKAAGALERAGRHEQVPMVCLHFGVAQIPLQAMNYQDVWAGDQYNAETVQQIVQLLFGPEK